MSLLGKLKSLVAPGARARDDGTPEPDVPVYVIGDIHGRADLLDQLLGRIEADRQGADTAEDRLVFVGDYIDRGDESAAVLDRVAGLSWDRPDRVVCLMGNHERMLLDMLDDPATRGGRWLRYGGLQTLASYQIGGITQSSPPERLEEVADELRRALPDGIEDWLRALPLQWSSGDLHVCHAAAKPDLAMDDQPDEVLLWGHPSFLKTAREDGQWVAFGHTIFDAPEVRQRRIAVDTGAYYSGALTAAVIAPGRAVRFLSTGPGG